MMKELNYIKDKNPFKVPENYFEEVNRKIISETAGFGSEAKKKGLYIKLRPYLAVAAAFAGIILLSYTAVHILDTNKNKGGLPEIGFNEFSETYLNDIDMLTLEEDAASSGFFQEKTGVNNKDIIDYLVLENIEITDIYEHL